MGGKAGEGQNHGGGNEHETLKRRSTLDRRTDGMVKRWVGQKDGLVKKMGWSKDGLVKRWIGQKMDWSKDGLVKRWRQLGRAVCHGLSSQFFDHPIF
ncbi:hypothetical protein CKO51_07945 [Rhodopirellula sp. SM50]|nr:hypothetical protein [Rhodopirellula sp. SM50]PAY20020.1 hypothetical protein CKO51_07945 [Rhodopirellula sp. SM50]